jgi:hypothetical protein
MNNAQHGGLLAEHSLELFHHRNVPCFIDVRSCLVDQDDSGPGQNETTEANELFLAQ